MEEFEAVKAQRAFEEDEENRVIVPETLIRPHPITAATRKALQAAKPDDYGMLKCAAPELFYLRLGPNSVNRALRILDALLKAFDARSFKVVCGVHERERTRVVVNGEDITFSIEETAQRQAHRLTEEEKKRQKEGTLYYVHTYDYIPGGTLTLKLDTPYSSGITGTFTDRARQSLEQKLNGVMLSMVHVAEWRKEERRRQEEKGRRLEAENARRAEIRRRHAEEAARVKQLQKDADAWNAAEALRRYITAVEAQVNLSGAEMPIKDVPRWVRWAREQADRIDPLKKSPPSILDEKPPELLNGWQFE